MKPRIRAYSDEYEVWLDPWRGLSIAIEKEIDIFSGLFSSYMDKGLKDMGDL